MPDRVAHGGNSDRSALFGPVYYYTAIKDTHTMSSHGLNVPLLGRRRKNRDFAGTIPVGSVVSQQTSKLSEHSRARRQEMRLFPHSLSPAGIIRGTTNRPNTENIMWSRDRILGERERSRAHRYVRIRFCDWHLEQTETMLQKRV